MDLNQESHFYNAENGGCHGEFGTPSPVSPQPPKKKGKGAVKAIALVLVCALVGGGAGVGGAAVYGSLTQGSSQSQQAQAGSSSGTTITQSDRENTPVTVVNQGASDTPMTAAELYAANLGACVGITVSTTTTNFYGQTSTSAASGSGFVLTADGYIATNYHVIEDAVKDESVTIEVSFANGDHYPAQLVGGEKSNDIAVLKIDATGLQTVVLGDSDKLVVGQSVFAIGNPLGELTFTLTDGMVSALDRLITTSSYDEETRTTQSVTMNMLQTNCAVNPGNSGGPLFNEYGEVVGIVSAKYSTSSSGTSVEGLGFAIPINDVVSMFTDIIQHGYVTGKPYMGVVVTSVPESVQRYGISAGAYVESVAEGSAAEKAGLQVGDVIVGIDGTAIDSNSALTAALNSYNAGDTATLKVERDRETVELRITFDEQNAETEAANQIPESSTQQESAQTSPYYDFPYYLPW